MKDMVGKLDLVMWTLNGEKTLPYCLHSIRKAVPKSVIGKKIVVDGGSVDRTKRICMFYGWTVVDAERRGIPFQANQALSMVQTEFFASFEQDIVLHPYWFKYIMRHFAKKNVAVAQGVRVAVNPILAAIDLYTISRQSGYSSLDNTLYNTEDIRGLGGFNCNLLSSLDRDLQRCVRKTGKQWIVDRSLISSHLHSSCWSELKHQHRIAQLDGLGSKTDTAKRLFFSPFRGLDIALKQKRPETVLYYPLLRLAKLSGALRC